MTTSDELRTKDPKAITKHHRIGHAIAADPQKKMLFKKKKEF